jgi:hypothetical protein
MSRFSPLVVAAFLLAVNLSGAAQDASEPLHAPDGGTLEMTTSIFIPPVKDAPFQAVVTLEWTRHLANGTTTVMKNHRLVVRDSQGSIYRERRTLVPEGSSREQPRVRRIEISIAAEHVKYFCDPALSRCEGRNYNVQVSDPEVPATNSRIPNPNLTHTDLGSQIIEGLNAVGTRENLIIPTGTVGNTAPLENTKEFWYSPQLGLNLRVLRLDPLHGDQSFAVTEIKLSEPDPELFVLPSNCNVVDLRHKDAPERNPE